MKHGLATFRRRSRRPDQPTPVRARRIVLFASGMFVAMQVSLSVLLEIGPAWIRDPEYGAKLKLLKNAISESGSVPIIAMGSSRLEVGLRPASVPGEPSLFNFGIVGGGPIQQRLLLHRLLRDGIQPDRIIVEFWPPFLFDLSGGREENRVDPRRFNLDDLAVFNRYAHDPATLSRKLSWLRVAPFYSHRVVLMNLLSPRWLPWERRMEWHWQWLDRQGWLRGQWIKPDPALRAERLKTSWQFYSPFLNAKEVDTGSVLAFEELIDECNRLGISVAMVWLPESTEFRSWYSPDAERISQQMFAEFGRRERVRLIDARTWATDESLDDGFHIDPDGAIEFSKRLQGALR